MNREQRRLRRRAPLRSEFLEHRVCFDATLAFMEGMLMIRGTEAAEEIAIVDQGHGHVRVSGPSVNGGEGVNFRDVREICVESGGGGDAVRLRLLDPAHAVPEVDVNLGPRGANRFNLDSAPTTAEDVAAHHLAIFGGGEGDAVALNFANGLGDWLVSAELGGGENQFVVKALGGTISEDSELVYDLHGGAGRDRVELNFTDFRGDADVQADLGAGDDALKASFAVGVPTDPDIVPCVRVAVNEGSGNGAIILQKTGGPADVDFQADLGDGADSFNARVTRDASDPGAIIPCVRVAVLGGGGNDLATIDLRGSHADFQIDANLGAGDDRLTVFAEPPPEVSAADPPPDVSRVTVRGGEGSDTIDVLFSQLGPRRVDCQIYGDEGNDLLRLEVVGIGDPDWLTALLDGGAGFDRVKAPRVAHVINAEA